MVPLKWRKYGSSRVTCETIYPTIGQSQGRPFPLTGDGGVHDSMHRKSVIEIVKGVDETFPRVHVASCLMLLRHSLLGQKSRWLFCQVFCISPFVQRLVAMIFGVDSQ